MCDRNGVRPASSQREIASDFWSAAGTILALQNRTPKLTPRASGSPVPLSFAQERLWALEQTEPGAPYYNVSLTWEIAGELNIPALEKTFQVLFERHPALRTSFPLLDGSPVQRVNDYTFTLPVENFSRHPAPADQAAQLARELASKPFNLESGPLFRVTLFERGPQDFWLVMIVHQMVFDGASMRVFSRDLGEAYRAFSNGLVPQLDSLPVRYTDFALWQREILNSEMVAEDEKFWTEQLGEPYKPLNLPTDHERRNFGITQGTQIPFGVPKDTMDQLKKISVDLGVTPFAAFLGTFQAFLGKLTGQPDILTLVSIASRNVPEVRNIIGLIANVLPMRLALPDGFGFRQMVARSGATVSASLAHQSLPLSKILEKLSTAADATGTPALQTLVIYNNAPLPVLKFAGVTFTPSLDLDNGTAKFDLLLEIWDSPNGLNGHLKYRADLFAPATIEALMCAWKDFLADSLAAPDNPLPTPLLSTQSTLGCAVTPVAPAANAYVAPRTTMKETLARIWQQVFALEQISVNDNFFGLGGHSLIAVKLINAIEKETGHKLRLCKIFSEPTIARLARSMQESGGTLGSSIVEIQPRGAKQPLYLVHGVGGGMFWGYNNLAHHLGNDQPVYAFKSRGMDGLEEFKTIEAMAEHYVADLKKFQPQGPYHLGGYCFGCNVAFEMARRLRADGNEVGLLLLINCWPNNSSYTQMTLSPDVLAKGFWNFCFRMGHQLRWGVQHPVDFFKARSRWAWKRFRALFTKDPLDRIAVEELVDLASRPASEQQLWRTHVEAWLKYMPGTYDGRITLLRTRGHPLVCSFDHQMGWGAYATKGVTVRTCPGDHESILESANVSHAAREIRFLLEQFLPGKQAAAKGQEEVEVYRLNAASNLALQSGACLSSVVIPAATCASEIADKINL